MTRHGRRGGCHARSPRVATRGFLGHTCQPPPQRTTRVTTTIGPRVSRPQSTTRVTTTIGPPVSRPQRTTRVTTTKSPRRKPGDSGSYPFPRAMRSGFETPDAHEARGMDNGVVVIPGVPGLPPGASWDTRVIPHHNGPPVSRPQSTTRVTATIDHPCHDHNGPPVSRPQSTTRVTTTKSPRRKPGRMMYANLRHPAAVRLAGRHPAWTAGWFSHPESPGFHPGLLGRVTRPIPKSTDLQNHGRKRIPAARTLCRATRRNIKTRGCGRHGGRGRLTARGFSSPPRRRDTGPGPGWSRPSSRSTRGPARSGHVPA